VNSSEFLTKLFTKYWQILLPLTFSLCGAATTAQAVCGALPVFGSNTNIFSGCANPGANTAAYTNVSSGNTLLLVSVEQNAGSPPMSATYGGTSLVLARQDPTSTGYLTIYYLVNPATGGNSLTINMPASACTWLVNAMTFSNVNQSTPLGNNLTQNGSGSIVTATMPIASNSLAVNALAQTVGVASSGGGQNMLYGSGGLWLDWKMSTGSGPAVMTYNLSASGSYTWQMVEIESAQAPCTPTITPTFSPSPTATNTPPPACGPPVLLGSAVVNQGFVSSLSSNFAYTCPAGNYVALLVRVETGGSSTQSPSSVSYGGFGMTLVRDDPLYAATGRMATYALAAPPAGSNTLVINYPATPSNNWSVVAEAYGNVSQASPIGATNYSTGAGSTFSPGITTTGPGSVVSNYLAISTANMASDPGQTSFGYPIGCCENVFGDYRTVGAPGSQIFSYTLSFATNYAIQSVEMQGMSCATATGTFTRTATSSPTRTATPSATFTRTSTPAFTPTNSPAVTPTFTPTSTPFLTPTNSPVVTPTGTAAGTATFTAAPTHSPTPSATSAGTATATPTPVASPTQTATVSPTGTPQPCGALYINSALVGSSGVDLNAPFTIQDGQSRLLLVAVSVNSGTDSITSVAYNGVPLGAPVASVFQNATHIWVYATTTLPGAGTYNLQVVHPAGAFISVWASAFAGIRQAAPIGAVSLYSAGSSENTFSQTINTQNDDSLLVSVVADQGTAIGLPGAKAGQTSLYGDNSAFSNGASYSQAGLVGAYGLGYNYSNFDFPEGIVLELVRELCAGETPTSTPTATPSASPSPSSTASPTPSPTATPSPTVSPTFTVSPVVSPTPTGTATATPLPNNIVFGSDAASTVANPSGSAVSMAFTPAVGANQLMVILVDGESGYFSSAVTFNGASATLQRFDANGANDFQAVYTLLAPAPGNHTLVVSPTVGQFNPIRVTAFTYLNVNQSSPVGAQNGGILTASNPPYNLSVTVTAASSSGTLLELSDIQACAGTYTLTAPGTLRYDLPYTLNSPHTLAFADFVNTSPGTVGTAFSWSGPPCSSPMVCQVLELLPAPLVSTSTPTAASSPTPTTTNTYTVSPTSTSTASQTYTVSPTSTSTASQTYTVSPTSTSTASQTYTVSPTPTFTNSNTFTVSPTSTFTITTTSTSTASPTTTSTVTKTFTASPTPTFSVSQTHTASPTPTFTVSGSPSASSTPIYSQTATPTASDTPVIPCGSAALNGGATVVGQGSVFSATNTISYNCPAGTNTLLLVRVEIGPSSVPIPSSVTYAGLPMSLVRSDVLYGGSGFIAAYSLLAAPAGVNNLVITFPSAPSNFWSVVAEPYVGVNQSAPIGATNFVSATAVVTGFTTGINAIGTGSAVSNFLAIGSATMVSSGQSSLGYTPGSNENIYGDYQISAAPGPLTFSYTTNAGTMHSAQMVEIQGVGCATSTSTSTPSPTRTGSASPTATPTTSGTFTASPTPTDTHSPTFTVSPTPTSTMTRTFTPTRTFTSSPTISSTASPTRTATPTNTPRPSASPTRSATETATPKPSATPLPTQTPVPTATPVFTAKATPTPALSAVLDRNIFRPAMGQPLGIAFIPPEAGFVTVRIFNLNGANVFTPFDAPVAMGAWVQAHWNGNNPQGQSVANGVYFVSIQGAGLHTVKKVVLIK
jgi:hypothetical protein